MHYKIVVIGGGPGGYVAAIRAAQLGARVALVEKEELGGTCLNRGCIPTKVLAAAAEVLAGIRKAGEFGISTGTVEVDMAALIERKRQVVKRLASGIQFLLQKNKVELVRGTAMLTSPRTVKVSLPGGTEQELEAENIVLATGSSPALIKSLGYDGRQVITSDEALNLTSVPGRLLIIGGGVVGCEFASIFAALGSTVTVVEMMPTILPTVDKEVSRYVQGIFKRQGITIKTRAAIKAVRKDAGGVVAELESGEEIAADLVLISVGRVLNTGGLGLAEVGVTLGERGEVLVNERMETSVPGIYAAGDITGKIQLAHVASAQGLVAVHNILGHNREMNYRVVPACIFTRPEVGVVGLTAEEARAQGYEVKTAKFPMMACGKAQAMGETEGFVKVVADAQTDRILGVHIVGPHASDLVAEAALALEMDMTAARLAQVIHAHPTLAEAVLEAAEGIHGLAIHA
ncbi:dihydrolipoyl dehydrogenase [Desulfofundulus thermosubterraneus]|uniref:Dihydrolipoyl dehydrogenase n=1 Tax=Desulfofundulus thermosubterraneus DSM 16057 TaxID=1121432 RepID=A0A1M6FGJ0_9FIRM|nr:dihydrolipoyl dehydrogenase [Desulfofundulus thermosubterraneus]SHI96848.1 dihydrolipoamide dehydrogenase [Desulfofundulus thermosubterraneus DSM 16057]